MKIMKLALKRVQIKPVQGNSSEQHEQYRRKKCKISEKGRGRKAK